MQIQNTFKQINVRNTFYTIFIIISLLIAGQVLHETGHALLCIAFDGRSTTNLISYNLCETTKPFTDFEISMIRIFGGATAALIGIATFIVLRHRNSQLASISQIAIIAMVITHSALGGLETFAYDFYVSNVNGMVGFGSYMLGLIVAISIFKFKRKGVKC